MGEAIKQGAVITGSPKTCVQSAKPRLVVMITDLFPDVRQAPGRAVPILPGKGDIAEFIKDQQIVVGIPLDKPLQVFVLAGLDQLVTRA